jgi:hypothetical protein
LVCKALSELDLPVRKRANEAAVHFGLRQQLGRRNAVTTKQQQNIPGQRKNVSLVVSLVEPEPLRTKNQKA